MYKELSKLSRKTTQFLKQAKYLVQYFTRENLWTLISTRRGGLAGKEVSKPLSQPEPGPGVECAGPTEAPSPSRTPWWKKSQRHTNLREGDRKVRSSRVAALLLGSDRRPGLAHKPPAACSAQAGVRLGGTTGQERQAPGAGSSHHGLPGAAPGSLAPLCREVTPRGEPTQDTAMSSLSRPFPKVMSLSPPSAPSS